MIDSADKTGASGIKYRSFRSIAEEFGVVRRTIAYYVRVLDITPHTFKLDSNKYITVEDYERMKAFRDARKERN